MVKVTQSETPMSGTGPDTRDEATVGPTADGCLGDSEIARRLADGQQDIILRGRHDESLALVVNSVKNRRNLKRNIERHEKVVKDDL